MKTTTKIQLLALATIQLVLSAAAHAQGTAFTYQGRLNVGTNTATGLFDLRFGLWDSQSGGNEQGNLLTNTATAVTNGLFTVQLDFGSQFLGAPRWLETGVRSNGVATVFSVLVPRQPLTPTPYAIYAASANATNLVGTVSGAQITPGSIGTTQLSNNVSLWNLSGTNISYSAGFVGLDTTSPDRPLAIQGIGGNGEWISLKDTNGVTRWHMNNEAGGLDFVQSGVADARLFLSANNGYVGIGTSTPQTPLDVFSSTFVQPAAQFDVANCGVPCGGSDYQEAIRLWNQNSLGQVGLGFLVNPSSFNAGVVPDVWIGTQYASTGNGNDFKIATRTNSTAARLTDRFYVNGTSGNVGIGTSTPGNKLDVQGSADFIGSVGIGTSTPGNKLEVQGSADFTGNVGIGTTTPGQPLDVAGSGLFEWANNFGTVYLGDTNHGIKAIYSSGVSLFTYGVTNGLFLQQTTGNVGLGTTTPNENLTIANVKGYNAGLKLTGANVGGIGMAIENTVTSGHKYDLFSVGPNFQPGVGAFALLDETAGSYRLVVSPNGNVGIGTNTPGDLLDVNGEINCMAINLTSDRNAKEDFTPLDPLEVLAKVATLPITEWQYKAGKDTDSAAARHIGPMAQDFSAAFALGHDDKHISVVDEGGVALAAIQGLNEKLEEKDARIQELEKSVAELKTLVNQLAGQQTGGAK